jgi:hypothetical protein
MTDLKVGDAVPELKAQHAEHVQRIEVIGMLAQHVPIDPRGLVEAPGGVETLAGLEVVRPRSRWCDCPCRRQCRGRRWRLAPGDPVRDALEQPLHRRLRSGVLRLESLRVVT